MVRLGALQTRRRVIGGVARPGSPTIPRRSSCPRDDDDDDIEPDADAATVRGIQPFRPRARPRAHAHRERRAPRQPRDDPRA